MDILNPLTAAWSQTKANNLLVVLVAVIVVLLVIRFIMRAVMGILLFRMRRFVRLGLIGVLGGVPLAGFGGFSSLDSLGASTIGYLCDTGYSTAALLQTYEQKPFQQAGQALHGFTNQMCNKR